MSSPHTDSARIYDFTAIRLARLVRQRRDAGVKRQFLWNWPAFGQTLAVDFPLSAANLSSSVARAR
jgi:hypothetical protein